MGGPRAEIAGVDGPLAVGGSGRYIFAAGTGDGNSLLHRWCGAYPGMNSALHLWFAYWGGGYVLFSCRCESVTAKARKSFVCKSYQLLPAPLSIVGDWSSCDCFLVVYHYQ
ncbi:hypothetical protein YC2023_008333 [Brassica napus]